MVYVEVVTPVEVSDEHVADEPEYQRYEYAVVPPDGCAVNVEYWPLSITCLMLWAQMRPVMN